MSERKLRWGVLSTANIGRVAVNPAIQASSNGDLVAVASRDAERARAFAEAAGIPRYHGSYEALLQDDGVDAVYIPLPNSLHREWVIAAAAHGKHILCEKPLALSAAECEQMQAAADAGGVKLMEAFMYRFHPRTERVVEAVHGGAIGTVRAIQTSFTFRLTRPDNIRLRPELGGGALMDVGCYCVNVSRTLAAAEPVQVQAWARFGESGVDVELSGAMRFASGLVSRFDCALTMERREGYEVAGEDGFLRVPSAFVSGPGACTYFEHRGKGPPAAHVVEGADQYRRMVEHFADCALHDRPLRYPVSEAAANMRAIEALLASARADGAVVDLAG